MEDLIKAINEIGKLIKDTDSKLSAKIDSIDEKLDNFKAKLDELKLSHDKQEERLDYIEKEIRVRNLVLFGIPEQEKTYFELEDVILNTINEDLQVECHKSEIQHVKRIGKISDKPRPINVGLTTYCKKVEIMKNKNKLTDIYIKEDYPLKVLKQRKNLQEQLKIEIEVGKKAFIKYNKLIVQEKYNMLENVHSDKYSRNKKRALSKESSPNTNNAKYSKCPYTPAVGH
ncbi:Endonuclease-reverse transcriptase [Operophtera brumata]|uniref:Endonuclease-reverse transcriptase n=1 Tax=Operophtera brumata TaxID=104452 RepID=A0A0L7K2J4_OPEBR|nr:Endonuclease-reverse transcriptase [Operophtera brumata]